MKKLKINPIMFNKYEDEDLFAASKSKTAEEFDIENEDKSDAEEELDERTHTKLLEDLKLLTKSKKTVVIKDVRSSGTRGTVVDPGVLLKRLGNMKLKNNALKLRALQKPLEKPVALRAKRAAGFESVAVEVNKWEKTVHSRRNAGQLHFPLQQVDVRIATVEKHKVPKMNSSLEQEVYSLLQGAKLVPEVKETQEEISTKQAMSLEEFKERNREVLRQRELKHRYERKVWLQNKTKSKKYHRLLRREKLKKTKAELEELQKTDPEAALEKLEELDRARVEERMTLRHKKSKWAQLQGLRANRDKNVLSSLKENMRMHRELTKKTKIKLDADDDEDDEDSNDRCITDQLKEHVGACEMGSIDPMNPWLKNLDKNLNPIAPVGTENDVSFIKFKKFWEEVNQRKEADKIAQSVADDHYQEEKFEAELDQVSLGGLAKIDRKDENEQLEAAGPQLDDANDSKPNTITIDMMFDDAEVELKKKVKRKIEKLVGNNDEQPWIKIKKKERKNKSVEVNNLSIIEYDFSTSKDGENINESLVKAKTLKEIEELSTSGQGKESSSSKEATAMLKKHGNLLKDNLINFKSNNSQPENKKVQIDPTKFINIDCKKLNTAMPANVISGVEGLDDEEEDCLKRTDNAVDIIRDVFADDFLIDEFRSEKEAAVDRDKPNDVSLDLPGWGNWTGTNITMKKKKFSKFRTRPPPGPPRKDASFGNVIYNEQSDVHKNLRKSMVSELPYQFSTVKDFEASIRAPVGRMFVPEKVHKKLTEPPVVTKIGTVICPMNEQELLKLQNKFTRKDSTKMKKSGSKKRLNTKANVLKNNKGKKKQAIKMIN